MLAGINKLRLSELMLRNPAMSTALALIHGRPADDWTLEKLARECGMSRAIFSEKFGT